MDRGSQGASKGVLLAIAAMLAAGFALSLAVFYPGYMSIDAEWVYKTPLDSMGDWQSPIMTLLWRAIDPIAPGSMSMMLLMLALYWGGFALVAFTVARHAAWLGIAAMALAFAPPAFFFAGLIWRDVLFADFWLFAAGLTFATASRPAATRWPAQTIAMLLVGIGVLLRPNAIIAAPLLAAYVIWPAAFRWKRAAFLLVPGIVTGYALIHVVYYSVLNVEREYPLHSVFVFDLGGITHFIGENKFPVAFTPEQTAMLTSTCYNPERWDYYWHITPCDFVMQRLMRKDDKVFGTPRLAAAWRDAVRSNPLAYLKHRLTVMAKFLGRDVLLVPVLGYEEPARRVHAGNPLFMAMISVQNVLRPIGLFSVGFWLALAILIYVLAWRLRDTPARAFALGTTGSGIVYVLTFLLVGVAADFRYGYWCVLASLVGAIALLAGRGASAASASGSPTAA
jgi:hypothetical protein